MTKKISLPGCFFQRGERWYWRVKLPGEDKHKTRPLMPRGAKYATKDRQTAEEVAKEMWQIALFGSDQIVNDDGSIAALVSVYMQHVKEYYAGSHEVENIELTLKYLVEQFSTVRAEDFQPLQLEEFQRELINKKLARTTINNHTNRVRRMYKWAVGKQRVPASVAFGLKCVANLKRGRSAAKESKKVKPVAEEYVRAALPFATPTVAAMIELQLLTGMRSSELCQVRPCDIDTTGDIWLYRPEHHKTAYLDHERIVAIGPQGQEVLRPYLNRKLDSYCFSPAESMQQMRDRRHEQRETPEGHGNKIGTNRKENPLRSPTECYDKDTYGRAVRRAITAARQAAKAAKKPQPPYWSPHQLRHTAATKVREELGLEVACAVLGHSDIDTTQLYAELNRAKAIEAARRLG